MRTILITGTRKGIGRYLAEQFLKNGDIVIGCSRDKSDLKHKNYCHYYKVDVSDEEQVKKMLSDWKKIDILINNAGIASMNHVLLTTTQKAHDIFNTNFFGTYLLSREVAKKMLLTGGCDIINFSTIATQVIVEGEAIYAASKAAVEMLTKVMARELKDKIKVNCVAPGIVNTDLSKHARVKLPLTKFEKIFETIQYFINNDITGQVFYSGQCLE